MALSSGSDVVAALDRHVPGALLDAGLALMVAVAVTIAIGVSRNLEDILAGSHTPRNSRSRPGAGPAALAVTVLVTSAATLQV